MGAYRMATVTFWQTSEPNEVKGNITVFMRYGVSDYTTLARGELTVEVPPDSSPREWLAAALEQLPRRSTL